MVSHCQPPLLIVLLMAAAARAGGLSPRDALTRFVTPEGIRVELVASEPDIRQPVTMSFDNRGRLWVIQYLQYPTPAGLRPVEVDRYLRTKYDKLPEPPPRGPRGADRITICEDTDGDGRADRFEDFVSGLNLASGMALGHGGVFVLQAPYLLFYPDRNEDDIPDGNPEVLLTGFGMEDAHAVANSLEWGPDGWLYGAQGSTVTANIRGIEFQQGIWRYHPRTHQFELFAEGGGNTWGLDFDFAGNAIAGTNFGGVAALHQVQGAYYVKNFGKHGALHNPHAYGYLDHLPYRGAEHIQNGEHVMCGGVIYKGGVFPFLDGRYVTCALLHRAIYWHEIEPAGSSFRMAWGGKLLTTDDTWFRPVDVCVGAEGAIYVADWYDERANHVDPVDSWDKTSGRIYRIVPEGAASVSPFDLTKKSSEELIGLLSHPNNWIVRQSRQLLAERCDSTAIEPLKTLLRQSGDTPSALEALWALYVSGGWDEQLGRELLDHPYPSVRAWSIRFLGDERQVQPATRASLVELATAEPEAVVRNQLACSCKRLPAADALPIAGALLTRSEDLHDPAIPLLLWWAIEDKSVSDREQVLAMFKDDAFWKLPLVRSSIIQRLARRYVAEASAAGHETCAALVACAPSSQDRELLIQGMELALRGRPSPEHSAPIAQKVAQLLQDGAPSGSLLRVAMMLGNRQAYELALSKIHDAQSPAAEREALLRTIGERADPQDLPMFFRLLAHEQDPQVLSAVLSALRQQSSEDVPGALLSRYPTASSRLKSEIREVLISRQPWTVELFGHVASGKIEPNEITLDQVQRAMLHFEDAPESPVGKLVEKHWGLIRPVTSGEVQARIAAVNNTLGGGPGHAESGKKLFTQHCAGCHTLFGEGSAIGPDLTGADRVNRQYLLENIINPAGQIRPEYAAYNVQTHDGRVLNGLLVQSTDERVTLRTAKNEQITVGLDEIEVLKQSTSSLMPEKILDPLRPQELRDLFRYLESRGS